jgi:hypothetical protein
MRKKKLTPEEVEDKRINDLHIMDFLYECDLVSQEEVDEFFNIEPLE